MSARVTSSDKIEDMFPETPVRKIITPIERLMKVETTGGIVLIIMTLAALIWANLSPSSYEHFWHLPFVVTIGSWVGTGDLHWFINDALMTIFFFNIGLEVKGEMTYGELRDPKAASLPIIAAAGGMLFPALIYLAPLPSGNVTWLGNPDGDGYRVCGGLHGDFGQEGAACAPRDDFDSCHC